jgi:hypothetical protein
VWLRQRERDIDFGAMRFSGRGQGPEKIDILGHKMRFVLERQSLEQKQHDPSIFAIRV